MNEAWVNIGWANNAVRLDLKKVQGSSGLGVMQLRFHIEASCRDEVAAQKPLWFEGGVFAEGLERRVDT